jgi:protein-tyrosine phosphatase
VRIDLHCHYLPGVDDGVRTLAESQRLLVSLASLGYDRVVATPHIRSGMFENRRPGLTRAFDELVGLLGTSLEAPQPGLPKLGLAAEHYFDDVFVGLVGAREALPYPGGKAILVEFHYELWPRGIERQLFRLEVAGLTPVLAHPERYRELEKRSDALESLLDHGVRSLLDLMSLTGKYGERSRRTAERLLEEGLYDAACSDCHRPEDVDHVARAIERLEGLLGREEAEALLSANPAAILDGTYEP